MDGSRYLGSSFLQGVGALAACGVPLLICTQLSFFYSVAYRHVRVGLFVLFSLCSVVPTLHSLILSSFDARVIDMACGMACVGATYLAGTLLYVTQVPESLVPRKFDYTFNSHQIWHCAVVLAAYLHWRTVVQLWAATSCELRAAA